MKIAMLTNNYKPFVGGVPISVERQAQELIKRGHEVTVFAPYYENTEKADASSPERIVRYHSRNRRMANGMVYPGLVLNEITAAFEQESFDCIHVHHPMFVGPYALYLGRKYELPVVYTYHTRYEDYLHYLPVFREEGPSGSLRRMAGNIAGKYVVPAYMKWFCNQCDLVIAPSSGMRRIMRGNGITTETEILPTGLDDAFYTGSQEKQEAIKQKYKKEKRYLFSTVSRLEQEKNYCFLLRGIAELKSKIGSCFRVMIIGDGSQAAELKTKAAFLGIGDVVEFVGNVPNQEVRDYLGASDAFLFASKSETQGIVLVEAMAAGCPVVAVDAIGVDDVIRDGINGFLTEESEAEWADRAAELVGSWRYPERKAAALLTAESYRASVLAQREEEIYRRCIRDKVESRYSILGGNAIQELPIPAKMQNYDIMSLAATCACAEEP